MKNGGPAFPAYKRVNLTPNGEQFVEDTSPGMSLRDYFAAKAMQGRITYSAPFDLRQKEGADYYAKWAYELADSMLAEREKSG